MQDVFSSIRSLLKVDSTIIDNHVFQLHYKATMFILVAASLLLTQRQYFGDPIDCIVEGVDNNVMDTYCWIHATSTIPALAPHNTPHPGVGPEYVPGSTDKQERKFHKYYQWVTLFLYFQAVLFYVPRYLWKQWEGGKVKMLVAGLDSPIVDEEAKKERQVGLVEYFAINLHGNSTYALRFFLCEVLNFVNVIGQIYFTDRFLGYEFTTYGSRVLSFAAQDLGTRNDPMDQVFPKVTQCSFRKFGASGSHELLDGLCVLPLNVLSEKIFIFLWFWYIMVSVVTAVHLVYRILTLATPPVRRLMLRWRAVLSPAATTDAVAKKCAVGDWFLLYQLVRNMDPLICKEVMGALSDKLNEKERQ